MYSSARAYDCRSASDGASAGSGTRSVISAVIPGLVPQVTCGPSPAASIVTTVASYVGAGIGSELLPARDARVPTPGAVGARGRPCR